jgi:hypothetical protein
MLCGAQHKSDRKRRIDSEERNRQKHDRERGLSIASEKLGNATRYSEARATIAPKTPGDTVRSAMNPPKKYPAVSAASTVEISAAQV